MRVVRDRYRSRVYGRDMSEVMLDEVFEKVCFFNDDEHDETHSFTKALKKRRFLYCSSQYPSLSLLLTIAST